MNDTKMVDMSNKVKLNSADTATEPDNIGSKSDAAGSVRPKERKKVFPEVLHDLLDFAAGDNDVSNIVMWLPSGAAFVIFEPQKFETLVLPKFFPQSRYASFTRKLNRWGFRQIAKGPDRGAFHHDLFRKDNPQLCLQMTCVKARKTPSFDEQSRAYLSLQQPYATSISSSRSLGAAVAPSMNSIQLGAGKQGLGNFSLTEGSLPFNNYSAASAESLGETIRKQQQALEVQMAKLSQQRYIIENQALALQNGMSTTRGDQISATTLTPVDEESAMMRAAGSSRNILQQMGHFVDGMHDRIDADRMRDIQPSPLESFGLTDHSRSLQLSGGERGVNEIQGLLLKQHAEQAQLSSYGGQGTSHEGINSFGFQQNFPKHVQQQASNMQLPATPRQEKLDFAQEYNFDQSALLRFQYQQQMTLNALHAKAQDNFGAGSDGSQQLSTEANFGSKFSPQELYQMAALQQQSGGASLNPDGSPSRMENKFDGSRAA